MFAVIATGGKQYIVREGDVLRVELLPTEAGKELTFDALLVADEEGKNVKVGTPTVSGAKVSTKVVQNGRADKILVVKYKPKSRYRRQVGHRQSFTELKVEKISA